MVAGCVRCGWHQVDRGGSLGYFVHHGVCRCRDVDVDADADLASFSSCALYPGNSS